MPSVPIASPTAHFINDTKKPEPREAIKICIQRAERESVGMSVVGDGSLDHQAWGWWLQR